VDRSVYAGVGKKEDTAGIAKRVAQISVSAIKQMPVLASKLEGCISLGQGIPSFGTPSFIRKRIIAALAGVISTIVERDDEVLIPSPNYSSHIEQILFAEGKPVFVPLIEEEGWRLDMEGFRKALTKKTKAILLCNPMNPTGAVFPEKDLKALAEMALERNLFIISDEAYDFLLYDRLPHFSLGSIPELKEQLITCKSFSKMYCMTGWRVGPSKNIMSIAAVFSWRLLSGNGLW